MERTSRAVGAAALVTFEVGAIAVLHALGNVSWLEVPWRRLASWLQATPAEDSLPALLRIVALALAYWLAISTMLYALARLTSLRTAIRVAQWATLPAVRRVIDRTAALTIVAATVAGPSSPVVADDGSQPIVIEISDRGLPFPAPVADEETPHPPTLQPEGVTRVGWTPTPAGEASVTASEEAATVAPRLDKPTAWPVETGDNLWTIAARHLAAMSDQDTARHDIAGYWRRVVAANRDVIRSGDPDLIYPGETIVLPPVTESSP